MIALNAFINSCGEIAYDCCNRNDMLLREVEYTGDVVTIYTECGYIFVTPDTRLMNNKGLWVRADKLHVGNSLKSYTMNHAVVTGVTYNCVKRTPMFNIVDCENGYLIIDNFFIS